MRRAAGRGVFRASSSCSRSGSVLLAVCLAIASVQAAADAGPRERYLLHCSGCHGPRGHGAPGVTPGLRDLSRVLATPGGRAYLASVPGVAQAPLDDAALALLLNWVIAELSGAVDPAPYTAREVGRLRATPLRDPVAARRRLALDD